MIDANSKLDWSSFAVRKTAMSSIISPLARLLLILTHFISMTFPPLIYLPLRYLSVVTSSSKVFSEIAEMIYLSFWGYVNRSLISLFLFVIFFNLVFSKRSHCGTKSPSSSYYCLLRILYSMWEDWHCSEFK